MAQLEAHLGIICSFNYATYPPFGEKGFYRILSRYGQKKGIHVTVFSLRDISWSKNQIRGYRYSSSKSIWIQGIYSLPPFIYDRIFYTSKSQFQINRPLIKRLIQQKKVVFLGHGLPGKWKVYEMCKENPHLLPFLPETIKLNQHIDWQQKLTKYSALFFKPVGGSHGKHVFKLSKTNGSIHIRGRTATNQLFSLNFRSVKKCEAWLQQVSRKKNYIIQPYLSLNTKNNMPFDIRILVQKNEYGQWTETGRVVRIGKKNSLTSNLHGGGTAVQTKIFLTQHYSAEQIKAIDEQLLTIVYHLPRQLEEKHGSLVELGIDVGIDTRGKAWLLEANSKPGRQSFRLTQDKKMLKNSLLAPIRYTQYVLSQYGRSI